jgi:hypothetical protein
MKTLGFMAVAVAAGFASGCVTVKATTAPQANLSHYRTFSWFQPQTPPKAGTISFEQTPAGQIIRDQISRDLAGKGITETTDNPDFLVAYHSKLQQKLDVSDWGYPGFWWGGPGGVSVNEYTQGTLFIDFIDPKTNQVFWRGTASAVVDHPDTPNEKKLASAVGKVMKKYPSEVASAGTRPAM